MRYVLKAIDPSITDVCLFFVTFDGQAVTAITRQDGTPVHMADPAYTEVEDAFYVDQMRAGLQGWPPAWTN